MTAEEITTVVTKVAKDFDLGKHDTNNLIRYFIAKYCIWMTREAIANLCGVTIQNVRVAIKTVQHDSRYAFVKLKIHQAIDKEIKQFV